MDTADLGYMCRTVVQDQRWSDTDDNSDADSVAELEYKTWDACACRYRSALVHIPPGLVQNPPMDKIRNYNTNNMSDTDSVAELNYSAWNDACEGDYQNMLGNIHNPPKCKIWNDDTDHGSDADSVAELEYKTWEDACAWRCRSALVNIPPGLVQNSATGHIRHYKTDDNSDADSVAELECNTGEVNVPPGLFQNSPMGITRAYETDGDSDADSAAELMDYIGNDTCAWECRSVLLRFNQNRPTDILYPAIISCRQTKDMNCLTHGVCYDCICLMILLRNTITLFSEGDRTVAITGYDGGYDGFPAGLLGCLPRCLSLLWVMNGMTQHQMKINGPDSDILVRRTMDDRGRRGVWISDTPPATLTVKRLFTGPLWAVRSAILIGCARPALQFTAAEISCVCRKSRLICVITGIAFTRGNCRPGIICSYHHNRVKSIFRIPCHSPIESVHNHWSAQQPH